MRRRWATRTGRARGGRRPPPPSRPEAPGPPRARPRQQQERQGRGASGRGRREGPVGFRPPASPTRLARGGTGRPCAKQEARKALFPASTSSGGGIAPRAWTRTPRRGASGRPRAATDSGSSFLRACPGSWQRTLVRGRTGRLGSPPGRMPPPPSPPSPSLTPLRRPLRSVAPGLAMHGPGAGAGPQSGSSLGRRSDGADGLVSSLRQARSEASLSSGDSDAGLDSGCETEAEAVAETGAPAGEGSAESGTAHGAIAAGGAASDVMLTGEKCGEGEAKVEEAEEVVEEEGGAGQREATGSPAVPLTAGRARSPPSASAELSAIQSPGSSQRGAHKAGREAKATSSYHRRPRKRGGAVIAANARPATSFGALPSPIVLRARSVRLNPPPMRPSCRARSQLTGRLPSPVVCGRLWRRAACPRRRRHS